MCSETLRSPGPLLLLVPAVNRLLLLVSRNWTVSRQGRRVAAGIGLTEADGAEEIAIFVALVFTGDSMYGIGPDVFDVTSVSTFRNDFDLNMAGADEDKGGGGNAGRGTVDDALD